jgi:isopenicillin-N epimerase
VDWLLDASVTHLNHGSYGACPRPVLEAQQAWQRELERSPTDFLWRRLPALLDEARGAIGGLVGARPDELALVHNTTSGLNAVIRSLRLEAGDEVLTTAHEYGALVRTWAFVDATLVVVEPDAIADAIGPRTRVVFLSHITSETASVLPVEAACAAAREAGVLSVVDGAHVPGHLTLDLSALGADVYAGNCHKWLSAPKGSAFLWARPEHHGWIEPVVTSWGWQRDARFAEKHEWQGTFDPSAWLTIPTAVAVWRGLDHQAGDELVARGRELLPPIAGIPAPRMWSSELPAGDAEALRETLLERHPIEVPVLEWRGRRLVRVSVAPYTTAGDLDRLHAALEAELGAWPKVAAA